MIECEKSKFDFSSFRGECIHNFAVSKKYTKEEAIDIYIREFLDPKYDKGFIVITEDYVTHRAGVDEDQGRPCVCWWLEGGRPYKRSCPVWAFHFTKDKDSKKEKYFSGKYHYEYVPFGESEAKHND